MRINPKLDLEAASAALAHKRWLQLKDFLSAEDAEDVHGLLSTSTPWWLVYNVGDRVEEITSDRLEQLDPSQVEQIFSAVVQRAQTQYQFIYASFPIVGNLCGPEQPKHPLVDVLRFLNSESVLDWFRKLTGRCDVQWVDAQATLYQAGHFLKSHSDLDDSNSRAAAYVMNFTKLWERDWGGYLQFFNDSHDIEYALRPIFNALNIFLVPIDHSVSIVSPFAYGDRLSITGWLRTDTPPEQIAALNEVEG